MVSIKMMNLLLSGFSLISLGICQTTGFEVVGRPGLMLPPKLGLGTWYLDISEKNTSDAIAGAIETGYRHIDCAQIYGNQKAIGVGIKEGLSRAKINRSDLWVTSKLWDDRHHDAELGIKETLDQLGLEYIDLYLMHFPIGEANATYKFDHVETWKRMERLVRPNGPVRFLGVANFGPQLLQELLASATIKPLVHQFELHPYLQQRDWLAQNQALNLSIIAYAPLGNTSPVYRETFYANQAVLAGLPMLLENDVIKGIATKRGCTPVQVVLAWNIGRNVAVIPKSSHLYRQEENWGAWNCKLEKEDDATIKGIEETYKPRRVLNVCALFGMNCYVGLTGMDAWATWKSPLLR